MIARRQGAPLTLIASIFVYLGWKLFTPSVQRAIKYKSL